MSVKLQRVSSQQQSTPLVSSKNKAQHQDGKRGAAVASSGPSDTVDDDVVREQNAADVQAPGRRDRLRLAVIGCSIGERITTASLL